MVCWLRNVTIVCFSLPFAFGAERVPLQQGGVDCHRLAVKQNIRYGDKVFRPKDNMSVVSIHGEIASRSIASEENIPGNFKKIFPRKIFRSRKMSH